MVDVLVSLWMLEVIQHVVGLVALWAEFTCCKCTKLTHFLTCTGIPCRVSHCENGLVRCCLYTTRRLQQTAVTCTRSNCNKFWKYLENRHVWGSVQRRQTTGPPVLSCRFAFMLICGRSLNYYELHEESLHFHQLEEELDDSCHFWYFLNRTGLSCCSPDSWCKRFNVDNASLKSEQFLNGPLMSPDLLREIDQFCLYRKYSDSVM